MTEELPTTDMRKQKLDEFINNLHADPNVKKVQILDYDGEICRISYYIYNSTTEKMTKKQIEVVYYPEMDKFVEVT